MIRAIAPIFNGIVTALGVALLVFLALRLVPGDPVELMLGESAANTSREALRSQLGLNHPLREQFTNYAKALSHGDLGTSIALHRPVTKEISDALPFTIVLALAAAIFANAIGIPLGIYAAHRPRRWITHALFAISLLFLALPTFWLGPLLVIGFALRWPWLPVSSYVNASSILLPTLAMGCGLAAAIFQTTRAALAECLSADYIRTAYAKGASPLRVLFVHALPNAAVPILTVSALQFGHLLAGAVIIETIFDWPGIGRLLYDALLMRDYPTVQGTALVIALIYVAINMLTDFVNARKAGA